MFENLVSRKRQVVERNGVKFGPRGWVFSVYSVLLTVKCLRSFWDHSVDYRFSITLYLLCHRKPCISCAITPGTKRQRKPSSKCSSLVGWKFTIPSKRVVGWLQWLTRNLSKWRPRAAAPTLTSCGRRPAWSGMMQFLHRWSFWRASVIFLPLIDMNPSDTTCIYSTLKFISEHARHHDVTPIITFDRPLWWKALMIVTTEPEGSDLKGIVLRLGGFHTEMSFLGSLGGLIVARPDGVDLRTQCSMARPLHMPCVDTSLSMQH